MQTRRQLPNNIAELQAMLHAQFTAFDALAAKHDVTTAERDELKKSKLDDKEEIKRLALLIAKLKRMVFGQKSEKLSAQIAQLELELEELHITQGARAPVVEVAEIVERIAPKRRPLPEHLPRDIQTHMPAQSACPDCGGEWKILGEDVSEVLERVPASYRVIRHVRPRLTCSCCERMAQAPAPSRPIARSYFGPGLISHVIVSKYMDHLPIYRQCQQAAREGIELSESTVGDVVGGAHQLLRPLMDALQRYVFAAPKLHADDTPIDVLAPGNGKTKQGRLWVYTRDDRPAGDPTAPAVWFRYSPDRKGIHPQSHLKDYAGILQADAYAGYNPIYDSGQVLEAACWAHARRKFYDIQKVAFSRLTLVSEISRYLNLRPLEIEDILDNTKEGTDELVAVVNDFNELLYDEVIPRLFRTLFDLDETQQTEEHEVELIKLPPNGFYEMSAAPDKIVRMTDFKVEDRSKSFHLDTYCFDSKPEQQLFWDLIQEKKVKKVYFTGMLTHGQSDFFIQYIDPDSHTVRSYYPDFLFERDDGSFVIVEVKADNQIEDAVVQAKKEFAQQIAVASGMEYRMIKASDANERHYRMLL